jgi:DNA mismatch repair protein MutL
VVPTPPPPAPPHRAHRPPDIEVDEPVDFGKIRMEKSVPKPTVLTAPPSAAAPVPAVFCEKNPLLVREDAEEPAAVSEPAAPYRILGELFDTYILVSQGDELVIIDKHAVHERAIYNQIKNMGSDTAERQMLLSPILVTLSREEYHALSENPHVLEHVGIAAEDFGDRAFLVREVPTLLTGVEPAVLLGDVAAQVMKMRGNIPPAAVDELLYSVSCRAAVMAGKSSTAQELAHLAGLVLNSDPILYCPHGRPVCVRQPKREIEKLFGRV